MTCIAGWIEKEKDGPVVYLGGDSAGVAGFGLTVRADEKVFVNGPFAMGFTTSFRMGQLLRYALHPPQHTDGMDTLEYMVTLFVDAVRECLKAGGYARKVNEEESGGCFLVGYRGRLFQIDNDYQVGEPLDGYAAVGCGDDLALGAFYALQGRDILPEERVLTALRAAERGSAGVRGPFHIVHAP